MGFGKTADSGPLVKSSKDTTLDNWRMLIFGAPKTGKTFAALTASELYPQGDVLEPQPELRHLSDLLFIEADEGGLDGLREYNLAADYIDVSKESGGSLINKVFPQLMKEVEARVNDGVTKTVIVDTISTIDRMLKTYFQEQFTDPRHNAQMWGAVLGAHMKMFGALKRLRCNLLVIAHTKFRLDLGDATQKARQQATSMPGGSDAYPDISGQAKNYYNGAVSIQMPMIASPMPGGKFKRQFYPLGVGRYEAGSRFTRFLDDKEPAHIQKLINKIKTGDAGQS